MNKRMKDDFTQRREGAKRNEELEGCHDSAALAASRAGCNIGHPMPAARPHDAPFGMSRGTRNLIAWRLCALRERT